ncbi:unnamed protein product [Trypanosoma congolense IL3000]|uniref:WGS project CAEQ00000000 data, annotated contig 1193 n=1 Tax=Trypanosoma congolense (strain IL3000) TaxID=1068625 RepID=F9W4K2_TRYCI|nr:unnamed protein product [Trypanosoma congolense IL3000]
MNREAPTVKLPGHTDAVTGVAFNGVVSHLLLSCSKDTTLRLWDLSNTTTPHTMSVDARVLRGHTGAVQAIAWCNAAPYLALSAAADCTLRLWDVRSSACLFAVRAVGSGAVALSAHPQRPFIFAAGGSDGSVTFWHVGLLRQLSLESALGTIERYVTSDHAALMADPSLTQGTTAVASAESMQHLCKELQVANITAQKRMELIMDYFEFPCGAADVSRAAAFISNPGDVSNADCLVIPPAQLVDVYAARAKSFVEKAHNKSVAAAGEAYKSKRLMEAAERMLQLGKVQEYCDLMMEAGEFDAAIGTAPLISRDFWRSVCLKAAAVMKEKGDKRAVRYFIMAEESVLAARCLAAQSDKNWDAATVVLRTCPQRAEDQKSAETPHGTVVDTNGTSPAAAEVADAREALLKHSSNLRLIVASMLNGGANDAAAMQLVRSGDVLLAHLLIHTVPLQHRTTIDAGYRLSMLQSCSQQYWDTALVCATRQSNVYDAMATVLALYQQALIRPKAFNANKTDTRSQCDANAVQVAEKLKAFQEQILAECRRLQLPLDIASIQQKHANDGLASINQLATMTISPTKPVGTETSDGLIQTISSFIDSVFQAVLQDVDGANAVFYLKQAHMVSCYVSLPVILSSANASTEVPATGVPATPTPMQNRSRVQRRPSASPQYERLRPIRYTPRSLKNSLPKHFFLLR